MRVREKERKRSLCLSKGRFPFRAAAQVLFPGGGVTLANVETAWRFCYICEGACARWITTIMAPRINDTRLE